MDYILPKYVEFCLDTLESNGINAYLVGGCVRDMIMGIKPHDYDITVNADPTAVKACFNRTVDTGLKHGTVTVIINGEPIEITEMRTDGEYSDHRHPNGVTPTKNLCDDLARRDFTINAMAMDRQGNITDLFGGIDDINRRVLSCVGDPYCRFDEDALRIMRAFRFCSQLGFEMDDDTLTAALEKAPLLQHISAERIFVELKKTLIGQKPSVLSPLIGTNALSQYNISGKNDLSVLDSLDNDVNLRLAVLFIICGSDENGALINLKADKKTAKTVCTLCRSCRENALRNIDEFGLKRLIFDIGCDNCVLLAKLCAALKGADYMHICSMLEKVKSQPITMTDLAIKGRDLSEIGICGEEIGNMLYKLLNEVWRNPRFNDRNTLIDIAKNDMI